MSRVAPDVSAIAIADWIRAGRPVAALDVRERYERDYCKIEAEFTHDLHVPLSEVLNHLDSIRASSRPLLVYCHHGVRSRRVADWLAAHGLDEVFNLKGGIEAWSVDVDPRVARY